MATEPVPGPSDDWITQREVANFLGVSPDTASIWAAAGKLRAFEHGFPCARRRYSRRLVERELQHRWDEAVRRQDGADPE